MLELGDVRRCSLRLQVEFRAGNMCLQGSPRDCCASAGAFQCGGHKGRAKLGHTEKSWGGGGGVSRNCSNREGALWFAPVPVPGAIAEVPLPLSQEQQQPGVTWCCPAQSYLAQCSHWISLFEGSTWTAWGEGRRQRRVISLCPDVTYSKIPKQTLSEEPQKQGQGLPGQAVVPSRTWGREDNKHLQTLSWQHSLLQCSTPRAGNGAAWQIFPDLMCSLLCLRNIESSFGEFEVHLKAPLDCS